MIIGTAIVGVIASLGWLILNFRSLQAQGLSFEQKATMAVAWIVLFAGLTFILSRFGF